MINVKGKQFTIQTRNQLLKATRSWFENKDFLEVETPTLTRFTCPEPNLYPLGVTVQNIDQSQYQGYLILSPELFLKKLLASGYDCIFEIAKCFRNREYFDSSFHNIEFTLLEWYCKNKGYGEIITQCKNLLSFVAGQLNGSNTISYQNFEHSFKKWQEVRVAELFKNWANIDIDSLDHWDELITIAKEKNLNHCLDSNDAFSALFAHYIDPQITQTNSGLIVKDYPSFQGSLAKKSKDQRYVERFEIYFAGIELANGYSELCDSTEMLSRYEQFIQWHKNNNQKHYEIDMEFVHSLKCIDEAGGVAMGIDRLLMLMTDASSIKDVILFPTRDLFG